MALEFVRGITAADIIGAGLKNNIQPGELSEFDELMAEEVCASKLCLAIISFLLMIRNKDFNKPCLKLLLD